MILKYLKVNVYLLTASCHHCHIAAGTALVLRQVIYCTNVSFVLQYTPSAFTAHCDSALASA